MAYVRLPDLKAYLSITDESEDAVLQRLLNAAHAAFDHNFSYRFKPVRGVRHYRRTSLDTYDGMQALWLEAPLLSIDYILDAAGDAVPLDEVLVFPSSTVGPFYYLVWPENLGWGFSPTWGIGDTTGLYKSVEVSGRWAYTPGPPEDVKQAVLRLAAFWYTQRASQNGFTATSELGQNQVSAAIPDDVKALITQLQAQYELTT